MFGTILKSDKFSATMNLFRALYQSTSHAAPIAEQVIIYYQKLGQLGKSWSIGPAGELLRLNAANVFERVFIEGAPVITKQVS